MSEETRWMFKLGSSDFNKKKIKKNENKTRLHHAAGLNLSDDLFV